MSATVTVEKVPPHVPKELVWDHDLEKFQCEFNDPFVAVSRLHQGPDVIWATQLPHGQSGWVITRHALQQEAFVDHEHFTSKGGSGIGKLLGTPLELIPLEFDPPKHTAYRKVLNPFFTPVAINKLQASKPESLQGEGCSPTCRISSRNSGSPLRPNCYRRLSLPTSTGAR